MVNSRSTSTARSPYPSARRPLNNWVGVIGRGWPWPGLGFCGLVGLVGCRFGRPWCRPWGGPAPGPCWAGASGGGQCPGAVAAGEAAADEVAQVEGGGAALQAAAATAGKLGDDAFHVRPVAPVVIPQVGVLGPVAAGLAQQRVVVAQDELAAGLGRGAPLAQRAGATQRAEGGHPGDADRPGVAGGAGHRAGPLV